MEEPLPRPPGRPRSVTADETVIAATLELMREGGPDAVNVAAVATRAGLARTTVYRRYRNREDLLTRALQSVTEQGTPGYDLPVGEKFAWVLARAEEVLGEGIGLGGVAAVLTEVDRDFSAALRRALAAGLEPMREQLAADLPDSSPISVDAMVGLVIGSYLAEVLRHGSPPRPQWRSDAAAALAHLARA